MPSSYQKKNPASSFPAPKYFRVFDNPTRKNAILFFKYWAKLPPEKAELARVKVYRTWPRIDLGLVEPELKSYSWDVIDGPIPFDPNDYQNWFLEHYSSGNWLCQMYELRARPDSEIKVTECFFEAQDLDEYPPRVDYDTVLWDDPDNEPYERYLREHNIRIPGQGTRGSAAVRANAMAMNILCEALKSVVEQNRKLGDEYWNMMREIDDKIQKRLHMGGSKKSSSGEPSLEELRAHISFITEGARAAVEIFKTAIAPK
jgi:hypothetical protein